MTRFVLGLVALLLAGNALAQAYPFKPVTMIVPFPPGGSVDAVARQVGAGLAQYLGQSVVVENKVGAGGTIGSGFVAKAAPDGYTILLGTTSALAVSLCVISGLSVSLPLSAPIFRSRHRPAVI